MKNKKTATKKAETKKGVGLFEKIFNVQQAIAMAEKGGNNEFNKYKYARETDIITAVKPHLGAQKLVVTSNTVSHETIDKLKKITVEFCITDIESREFLKANYVGEGEDKAGSVVGTPIAYTMALKYFLAKMFIVETGDDAEIEKRKNTANESVQVKFDKALKMIGKIKDHSVLIEYADKLKVNKTFSEAQVKTLSGAVSSRIDDLNANQDK